MEKDYDPHVRLVLDGDRVVKVDPAKEEKHDRDEAKQQPRETSRPQ